MEGFDAPTAQPVLHKVQADWAAQASRDDIEFYKKELNAVRAERDAARAKLERGERGGSRLWAAEARRERDAARAERDEARAKLVMHTSAMLALRTGLSMCGHNEEYKLSHETALRWVDEQLGVRSDEECGE